MAVFARSGERVLRTARRGIPWKHLLAPLAVVALALGLAAAAHAAYAERALPGTTIGGVAVGSLDATAIRERLVAEVATPWAASTVSLVDSGRTWRATNAELGIAPDLDAAVAQALAYGKSGNVIDRAGAWIDALRGEANVPFAMRARGDALDRWVAAAARDADRAPVSGELRVTGKGLDATQPVLGREADRVATVAALLSATSLGDREVALRMRTVYPAVDPAGFDEAYVRASAVVTPLTVTVEDRTHAEDSAGLATLLVIERVAAKPGELAALPGDAIAPSTRYRYVVTLSSDRLATWVAALGVALDHPAKSAKFSVSAEGVVAVIAGESGVRIDQEKFRALLLEELIRPAGGKREMRATAAVDRPAFTTEQANELAPKISRTSTFTTYYPPSPERHANISTGASQFDGVVIMPGQTFSFWELLGPVTVQRGYAFAGAIINNRSEDNVIGGGLCQVSTTIFNAVAAQGYQIVERHSHGYYIDRYPIGYDAAVFEPGVDFKWRNDTANPVFLWSWSDWTSITIDVWGIPTGRTTVLSAPLQKNFVQPAVDQPADPHFPKGVTVAGRDVFRTRTVYEDGKVLHQDFFASHYAPVWGGPLPAPAPEQPKTP
ncbi:MAG TPA: VanW family protein [Candidatus Limnocylindria bacterium]|jgi:vancomycin resistance protein YoaR|nr:VanW family protein [Candidatus Limnocylindria bacterium]